MSEVNSNQQLSTTETKMAVIAPLLMFALFAGGLLLAFNLNRLQSWAALHSQGIAFTVLVMVYFLPLYGTSVYWLIRGHREREKWARSSMGNPGYQMGLLFGAASLVVLLIAIVAAAVY